MAENPTIQYLRTFKPDGTQYVPGPLPGQIPPNRTPAYRLTWHNSPPDTFMDHADLARTISSSLPDAQIFIDTCFVVGSELSDTLVDALLQRHIVFTPLVFHTELQNWLTNSQVKNVRLRDIVSDAHRNGNESITFLDPKSWSPEHYATFQYYTKLLGLRKTLWTMLEAELRSKYQRAPSKQELHTYCQQYVQDRGWVLATKGLEKRGQPNLLADEELVVLSVMSGILTGQEAIILTRDKDLIEQFYKLIYLIDTHYVSMLVADEYVKQPMNFPASDMPSTPETEQLFDGDSNYAIWLPAGYLKSPSLLPGVFDSVQLYCFCLANSSNREKVSFLSFSAEREMSALLDVKGISNGRNTHAIGKRNCHVYFAPNVAEFSGMAAIVHDRVIQIDGLSVPTVDRDLSLRRIERTARICHPSNAPEALHPNLLGWSLAVYRATGRLAFSWSGKWLSLTARELATAVTYTNPSTMFYMDASCLTVDVDDAVIEAWQEKRVLVPEITHYEGIKATRLVEALTRSIMAKARRKKAARDQSPLFSTSVWNPSTAYDYYVGLLAFRKLFFKVFEADFEKAHGRLPTEEEWCHECREICGNGGWGLADEGRRRQSDPSLFDEERLLVQAFLDAICQGRDVVVLTRNPLVLDQFARLAYLMRQHYIAAVLADQIADNTGRIELGKMEMPPDMPKTLFEGDMEGALITDTELQSMLPERPYPVNLHCWLFSGEDSAAPRLSVMSFCGERPMVKVLHTKAATGGRNTNRFEGRNIHAVGLRESPGQTQIAVVADRLIAVGSRNFPEDERLVLTQREYPAVDLVHVINKGVMPDVPAILEGA